ncbi:ArsR/SmtB family transcription factor [Cohnella nanjingensis]|uniref:Winged helix-turn-helix transcriptional regulator n=1 Tax=Cohnella nanjingensis TaxID=1387779 RepID=A0A7X0RL20_9BACL|nr:metalloregulator ArsR/SmtB family transcription factor [Cohnella nanjingensis]MBB6669437.1 winged helix-turn-helix transcriptional regulator [Cohnella nanjingensis]
MGAPPISIAEMSETLKLLGHPMRLTIMAMLREKETCVCDIVDVLDTTQPNASQHLKKLKDGGLVHETRRSQWIYYSLNLDDKPYLTEMIEQLPSMREKMQQIHSKGCS